MATKKTILFITHNVDEATFLGDRCFIFSRRPGRVKTTVQINIPRRSRIWKELVSNPEFTRPRDEILALVREEVVVGDQ